MQTALTYRTNRDLFSNYYLDEHLPETEAWDELSDDELREAKADIMDLWEREKGTAPKRNESQLEEKFIRPMFRKLGIPFEVEESTSRTQRRPDYGFFESEDAARGAFERREEGGDFYKDAVAVADAKRWGRPLDTRGSGEHERDFENPSYQIHVYLQETPARWAVLTDGKKWRLYYGPTSHRLDSYYEIDLPTVLEKGDLEDFKYFYLFFRHGAFLEDSGGECFLDEVYDESNVFAQELGEDLQDNIYEAIKILSEGFMQYPDNDLSEDDLGLIHDSSLIYLYRLIFVLYAESEGRDLLDTNNEIYEESYSLNTLKQDVAEELDSPNPKYRDWQDNLWDRLDELFKLIDQGSKSRGIPEEDLYIPAYNGGLFRTDPDEDDSVEARFLANHQVGDAYLAEVIELLTRSQNGNGGGKIFVDYSSLDVRHLGSIYEGLLEYQLDVADEPLALEDGEYVPAGEGDEVIVEEGEVHLSTGSGERKATGSYYTPEYVVEYIVEETLEPLVEDIREDLAGQTAHGEGGFAEEFADRIFELKILDPAMGSGHFLTSAIDYLAREIIDAQEKQAAQEGIETVDEQRDINWARRQVAQRCIYGVDLNPLAVELAKVSLWLRTLAAEQPLAFLDHHLKTGNSLVGSDIETVLDNGDPDNETEEGQLTLQESFDRTRRQALEHVTDQFEDLLAIDNETLDDIKEMEAVYDEVRKDPLYQHLIAMANVHTAGQFGLDVPEDAYERMAEALRDDSWADIEGQDWYKSAQAMAEDQRFFHWELEFPIAFYEQDGERKEDSGFDAVIGNPPYVRMEEFKELKNYLSQEYTTHADRTDLYIYFIERSTSDLLREDGEYGAIVSNKFLRANYGASVRSLLANGTNIREITDFGGLPVFPDATVRSAILLARNTEPDGAPPRYVPVESLDFDSLGAEVERSGFEVDPDGVQGEEWRLVNRRTSKIIQKLEQGRISLIEFLQDGEICWGIKTGRNAAFYINEEQRSDLIDQDPSSKEIIQPMVRGQHVGRYHIENPHQYLIYTYHGVNIDKYPAIEEYLRQYKEELEGRATEQAWYELQQPQEEYVEYFDGPKILYPEIAPEMRFAYDEGPLYPNNKCFFLPTERLSLMALLNSTLSAFYLRQILAKLEGVSGDDVYYEFRRQYMKRLPVCEGIDEVHEETGKSLSELADKMMQLRDERQSLNLSLLDYLGISSGDLPNSKAGESLEDLQMPVAGVADTPLTETTVEYDSLRIEGVSFKDDGGRVVLSVSISYKPDKNDPRETDSYGRLAESEFERYDAMAFVGFSEAEETLLREFVPVAVEEGGGFAGFRQGATKTNSPLDRLKNLMLPDFDEVQTGLEQYIEVRERADELEEKIEKTNQLIDKIVYDLYGLTDEEIEIVESAVRDD
ncbi:Eco57I restriction-modification methylase domain-containing protein [Halomicroarcula sp. S1AR25-4]|uniref:Eco57I restriction-modification methylase domain-containing protein n=1 Tax=Haloarcula sp. S1AR25-4 TaxID=2950538 RepID=UPI0028767321|nr:TaqI-like C-terminal specificity domain-containing protein [Halomicroarcula sp. S1AR25-4]MDS0280236.1 Eco57I restriction-modification methylase domain-containing protein [Halomicroarcula sp. S1AR25-4]